MSTTQLQLRRDTTANIDSVTPAQGEPIYDVTRKALVLGDGSTAGGNTVTPFGGAWTPQLQFGSASVGMTVSSAVGTWQQIGLFVIATFAITLTALGTSTGNASISGLSVGGAPNAAQSGGAGVVVGGNYASAITPVAGVLSGSASVSLWNSGTSGQPALTNASFTNTSVLWGTVVYPAALPIG